MILVLATMPLWAILHITQARYRLVKWLVRYLICFSSRCVVGGGELVIVNQLLVTSTFAFDDITAKTLKTTEKQLYGSIKSGFLGFPSV